MHNPARNWFTPEVVFQTLRLICRWIALEDALAMLRVYGDAEAMRWVGDGSVLDLGQCHEWISITLHNYVAKGTACLPWSAASLALSSVFAGPLIPAVRPRRKSNTRCRGPIGVKAWQPKR